MLYNIMNYMTAYTINKSNHRTCYNSIDAAKMIAALLVVAIHSQPFTGIANTIIIDVLARIAVPFFFLTSSYFFFIKPISKQNPIEYVKRLSILYVFWFIIESPITILNTFIEPETSFLHNLGLFVRNIFLGSTFRGSWFLTALMECVPLIFLLSKHLKTRTILVISVTIYIIAVLLTYYYIFLPEPLKIFSDTYRTYIGSMQLSWVSAFAPCAVGKFLAENSTKFEKWASKRISAGIIICGILSLAEVLTVKHLYNEKAFEHTNPDVYFMLLPLVVLIFIYTIRHEINLPLNYKKIRSISTIYYFSHFIFVYIIVIINKHIIHVDPILKYFIVVICCLILSEIILNLSNKKRFKWLKYGF